MKPFKTHKIETSSKSSKFLIVNSNKVFESMPSLHGFYNKAKTKNELGLLSRKINNAVYS